jgi:outer membrane protein
LTLTCLFSLAASLQAQLRVATVDLKKVFEGFYRTKQADAILKENGDDAEKILNGMMDEYKKANEDYKKLVESANDQAVSAEEREKRKKSGESKFAEIKEIEKSVTQYRNQARTSIDEQKRRLRDDIVKQLREAVNAKAKAGGYNLVLDVSGESLNNGTPLVLYASGQTDLSEEILVELNAKAPPGALTSTKEDKPVVTPPKTGDEKPVAEPIKPAKEEKAAPAPPTKGTKGKK